jgi:tripartite-type tricarboxylate transporter receptor subunit TctC
MKVYVFARIVTSALVLLASAGASAQPWPAKPIKWIVPYTAGGVTDIVTRTVLQKVSDQTGWTFTVENKPGGNTLIGTDFVAKAPSDGYTFLGIVSAIAANATFYKGRAPFDPAKDLAPVSLVAMAPVMMALAGDFAPNNLGELIAYARAHPGKVSFASSGVGSASHLTGELLKQSAGISMVHIPYRGGSAAVQDLLAGVIQVQLDGPALLMPAARTGRIKPIAVFTPERLAAFPNVPTAKESGGPKIESSSWVMFLAPAGVPRTILDAVSSEVAKAVRSPEVRARLEEGGLTPIGSTSAEAAKFLGDEIVKWERVIHAAGVKVE